MIAIVAGAMVVIVVIFVTVLVRCRHTSRFKAAQRKKQGAEWMSPNQENKQNKKKKRKKRKSPKSSLLNFVTIEENKPDDDQAHEPINGTISLPAELEEQGMGRFDWNAAPPTTTFKPSSPDLARHYKSASPQSAFHLKADTPVSAKKHHVIQELPLDNTFVGGCDTLSKRSSTSSDHFSASECSSQGGFKTKGHHTPIQTGRGSVFPAPSFEESECSFEIEVVIFYPTTTSGLIKIKIVVKDTNDNAPMFPSPVINISIPENTLINSRFAIPSATDPDTGPNSVHRYQLVNGQSAFGLDIVETPEGEKWPQLIVQQNLDREQKDTYVMKVKVEDGGTPQKSSTAILQVTVTDVNDNKPVFKESQIEVHIPENSPIGTSVVRLQATDADVGANAEIKFMLGTQVSPATKRLFALNGTTGLITVQRPLDREETAVHKLSVLASDGSSSPARATITINVTDVNDNPPNIDLRYIISPINGTVFLSEKDPINTKIALITVSDKDTDVNGKVICFIEKDVPFHLKAVYDNQYLLETSARCSTSRGPKSTTSKS
ncbi:hypothetical protein J4Q44_G00052130 [Coregonus suidteri]|uniref:Cadherin domain-containing protein n=1 Tax=Coregonus suidteri TaxID=861788 RepID=A0AAN8MG19_9TELE